MPLMRLVLIGLASSLRKASEYSVDLISSIVKDATVLMFRRVSITMPPGLFLSSSDTTTSSGCMKLVILILATKAMNGTIASTRSANGHIKISETIIATSKLARVTTRVLIGSPLKAWIIAASSWSCEVKCQRNAYRKTQLLAL